MFDTSFGWIVCLISFIVRVYMKHPGLPHKPNVVSSMSTFPDFPLHQQYDVIVVDAPWKYHKTHPSLRGLAPYPCLSLHVLRSLPVAQISKKNSVLLMWTTGPLMGDAIALMGVWGFTYKTVFLVWCKVSQSGLPRMLMGRYTRSCHEFMLIGVRGKTQHLKKASNIMQRVPDQKDDEADFDILIKDVIHRHSQKPSYAMHAIVSYFHTNTRKIELFSRERFEGFDAWGNELHPCFQINDE